MTPEQALSLCLAEAKGDERKALEIACRSISYLLARLGQPEPSGHNRNINFSVPRPAKPQPKAIDE